MQHSPEQLNSLDEVRERFRESGISVAWWARQRGFSLPLVYSVLSGRSQATRGESFRIGVALGLRSPPRNDEFFGTLPRLDAAAPALTREAAAM
jgi:gp16 family phage-associated protein